MKARNLDFFENLASREIEDKINLLINDCIFLQHIYKGELKATDENIRHLEEHKSNTIKYLNNCGIDSNYINYRIEKFL